MAKIPPRVNISPELRFPHELKVSLPLNIDLQRRVYPFVKLEREDE
jgi:hypothetical protein